MILILLIPVSVLLTGASLPSFYGETYYGVLPRMAERLREVPGPKIVVIGGSNVAFGLDSRYLETVLAERGYDYTVCPFGLYAAVGTSAMLDLSRDALGEGDIVVLAIEPTSETMSDYFGAETFWKCAEDAPELILSLEKERKAALAGTYLTYLGERRGILESGILPTGQGVYAASSFDERCELVYDRPGNLLAAGFDPALRVDLGAVQVSPGLSEQVREYCAEAERKGASVLLSFSPVNRSSLTDQSEEAVEAFFRTCNDAFSCPVISDPNRYILDSGWFYDSNFHLNPAGARVRTRLLAEDLLVWLGCWEDPGLADPEMPPSVFRVEETAEETDLFTFSPAEGGYRITGLTEAGLSRTHLRLPGAYEGKPVTGISPDALEQAAVLEQLSVPESVTELPDGLFRNTKNLTRLMLEHRNYPCDIGENTFRDASHVEVFVPTDAYPMYRDGYGCETNPWSGHLDRIRTYQPAE